MTGLQTALPRYCWRKPLLDGDGRGRWQLPSPLERIGHAEKQADRKKKNTDHNAWPYTPGLFEPCYWLWASIEWYDRERIKYEHHDITTISYAELTVAFQLTKGVNPYEGIDSEPAKSNA